MFWFEDKLKNLITLMFHTKIWNETDYLN
jgi:hypothetical protein